MYKTTNYFTALALCVCWGALFTGCTGDGDKEKTSTLIPKPTPYFADLPIPVGFDLVENSSEDGLTTTQRLYVRHLYSGKGDPYAVRNFFRDELTRHNWTLHHAIVANGVHRMNFDNGKERCDITISRRSSGLGQRTQIELLVVQANNDAPVFEAGKK